MHVREMARGEESGIPVEAELWFVFEVRREHDLEREHLRQEGRSPRSRGAAGVGGANQASRHRGLVLR